MLDVLRRHPRFRRIWLAQVVSQTGDWLGRVAVLALIDELAGRDAALLGLGALFGFELVVRVLPPALVGPVAGPVADRLPRRLLMVTADVLRAAIVLGLLLVREPGQLPLLYGLIVAQMGVGMFFEAARSASIPNTVSREDLHAAYALAAATWSLMLAAGSVLGGALVGLVGVRGVFVLDAATYLASGALLIGLHLPPVPAHPDPFRLVDVLSLRDLRRGWEHVRARGLVPVVLVKAFWGTAGGLIVLLSIVGTDRFGERWGPAFAIGALFCARGVGTGLGPVIARRLWGTSDRSLRRQIAGGYLIALAGYGTFAVAGSLPLAFACVAFAHVGGSTIWVASTTWWQRHVDDAFRGRVYTLEFQGAMLTTAAASLLSGWLYDGDGSLARTVWIVCAIVLAAGTCWLTLALRMDLPETASQST